MRIFFLQKLLYLLQNTQSMKCTIKVMEGPSKSEQIYREVLSSVVKSVTFNTVYNPLDQVCFLAQGCLCETNVVCPWIVQVAGLDIKAKNTFHIFCFFFIFFLFILFVISQLYVTSYICYLTSGEKILSDQAIRPCKSMNCRGCLQTSIYWLLRFWWAHNLVKIDLIINSWYANEPSLAV